MKNIAILLISAIILVACSGGGKGPPRNLNDACSMKNQRSGWFKTMAKAERKWGVPTPVFLAMIYQESKFTPGARTPHRYAMGIIPMGRQSSAYGYSQALDGTWKEYKRAAGGFGAKRNNFADAVDFMGWYMDGSEKRLGISKYDVYNQYLAYHEGRTGYRRGSYRRKSWLMRITKQVQTRAIMYQDQLRTCGG